MRIIKDIGSTVRFSRAAKKAGRTIGYVPTMGYLHEGHLSLVRAAKRSCDVTVVSIFVNPMQFGPGEDLKKYPRDLKNDIKLLSSLNVDAVFIPSGREVFPTGFATAIEVSSLSAHLCGGSRPGHFRGVATVVAKLLNIVSPDAAFFGKKDFQQYVIIKRMVADLNMPVKIVGLATVRERDGLAMSSRNSYLDAAQRLAAAVLYRSLKLARSMAGRGIRDSNRIIRAMSELISSVRPKVTIDYIEICDPDTLKRKAKIEGTSLIAVAAFVGRTRLIDNVVVRG